jgi:two-component system chemotaxis sensor kinase CheA
MDDLLSEFVAEAQDMLGALAGEIVAWEKDPGDRARLDTIFRFFHTIKGNCGFFDFSELEALSHAAEDVLSDVRAGRRQPDSALVDAVLAVIDRISDMITAIENGETLAGKNDAQLIAALQGCNDEEAIVVSEEADETAFEDEPRKRNAGTRRRRSIRLPVELLDRIMSGVSDMVLARNDLARRINQHDAFTDLEAPFNRLGSILDDVRDAISRTRMQPIETLFSAFPRMVRDLSSELGKQVMVEMENGDVELDRELIEVIRDPLVHVIRNAVDHGIEAPADRIEVGKHEIGLLKISARQTGNEIRIGVIDDGRGINTDRLIEKAIAMKLIKPEDVDKMSPRERNLLICAPGISTSKEVTSVSGRGVGMDVVRANLEQIGGSLVIDTTPGSGTRIMLNVPLTLSIVPSLTVDVGGQKFAIPRSYVEEVVRIDSEEADLSHVGSAKLLSVRDKHIPCVALAGVLGIENDRSEQMLVVIRLVGGDQVGLAVDQVIEHEELVVKPLAPIVMACGFFVGNTLMDDGSPVLMLDVSGIARAAGMIREVERSQLMRVDEEERKEAEKRRIPVLLLRGLDGEKRAVNMQSVLRVERAASSAIRQAGLHSKVVVDDAIFPIAGIPVGYELPKTVNMLRLTDGVEQVAYAFAEMIDISSIEAELAPDKGNDETAGIALIEGAPVEVLDCHQLFSQVGSGLPRDLRPTCHLDSDDRWAQEFLRPLVEAAGYCVDDTGDSDPDLAIIMDGGEAEVAQRASRSIRLHSKANGSAPTDGSIYRYDRERLLEALQAMKKVAGA